MKFLRKLFKHIVIGLVMAAIGVSIGLVVLYYKETGRHFNPLDKAQRDWAQSRIRSAARDARQRVFRTREGLEDWFSKQKEELPKTQDLLKRAIAYLEEDEEPSSTGAAPEQPAPSERKDAAPVPPDFSTFADDAGTPAKSCPIDGPCDTTAPAEKPVEGAAAAEVKPVPEGDAPAAGTTPEETPPAIAVKPAETLEPATEPATETALPSISADEKAALLEQAGRHLSRGKRHFLATMMPGRKDAVSELGKADKELRTAQEMLSALLRKSPGDPEAENMLAEVDGYIKSLPEIGEVPEVEEPVEVASVPEKAEGVAPEKTDTDTSEDVLAAGEALDAAIGLSERPSSRLTDRQKLDLAKQNFKKGLEHWRHSMSPEPNWLSNLNEATMRFEKAQSLLQQYVEKHPNDEEVNKLFLDVNKFLYDCYKRTPVRRL